LFDADLSALGRHFGDAARTPSENTLALFADFHVLLHLFSVHILDAVSSLLNLAFCDFPLHYSDFPLHYSDFFPFSFSFSQQTFQLLCNAVREKSLPSLAAAMASDSWATLASILGEARKGTIHNS
jgi:hypothetical protein